MPQGNQGKKRPPKGRRRSRLLLAAPLVVIGVVVAVVAVLLTSGGGSDVKISAADANWSPEPYSGGARLAVDRAEVDHGDVAYGQAVGATYRLKNVGDAALTLGQPTVNTLEGCWPPQPVVGQTTLKPGEETTVAVQFSMHEGMGGPHMFEIVVPSNDDLEPAISLIVKAAYPLP